MTTRAPAGNSIAFEISLIDTGVVARLERHQQALRQLALEADRADAALQKLSRHNLSGMGLSGRPPTDRGPDTGMVSGATTKPPPAPDAPPIISGMTVNATTVTVNATTVIVNGPVHGGTAVDSSRGTKPQQSPSSREIFAESTSQPIEWGRGQRFHPSGEPMQHGYVGRVYGSDQPAYYVEKDEQGRWVGRHRASGQERVFRSASSARHTLQAFHSEGGDVNLANVREILTEAEAWKASVGRPGRGISRFSPEGRLAGNYETTFGKLGEQLAHLSEDPYDKQKREWDKLRAQLVRGEVQMTPAEIRAARPVDPQVQFARNLSVIDEDEFDRWLREFEDTKESNRRPPPMPQNQPLPNTFGFMKSPLYTQRTPLTKPPPMTDDERRKLGGEMLRTRKKEWFPTHHVPRLTRENVEDYKRTAMAMDPNFTWHTSEVAAERNIGRYEERRKSHIVQLESGRFGLYQDVQKYGPDAETFETKQLAALRAREDEIDQRFKNKERYLAREDKRNAETFGLTEENRSGLEREGKEYLQDLEREGERVTHLERKEANQSEAQAHMQAAKDKWARERRENAEYEAARAARMKDMPLSPLLTDTPTYTTPLEVKEFLQEEGVKYKSLKHLNVSPYPSTFDPTTMEGDIDTWRERTLPSEGHARAELEGNAKYLPYVNLGNDRFSLVRDIDQMGQENAPKFDTVSAVVRRARLHATRDVEGPEVADRLEREMEEYSQRQRSVTAPRTGTDYFREPLPWELHPSDPNYEPPWSQRGFMGGESLPDFPGQQPSFGIDPYNPTVGGGGSGMRAQATPMQQNMASGGGKRTPLSDLDWDKDSKKRIRDALFEAQKGMSPVRDAAGNFIPLDRSTMEIDHIIARALGGSSNIYNLQLLNRAENLLKSNAAPGQPGFVSRHLQMPESDLWFLSQDPDYSETKAPRDQTATSGQGGVVGGGGAPPHGHIDPDDLGETPLMFQRGANRMPEGMQKDMNKHLMLKYKMYEFYQDAVKGRITPEAADMMATLTGSQDYSDRAFKTLADFDVRNPNFFGGLSEDLDIRKTQLQGIYREILEVSEIDLRKTKGMSGMFPKLEEAAHMKGAKSFNLESLMTERFKLFKKYVDLEENEASKETLRNFRRANRIDELDELIVAHRGVVFGGLSPADDIPFQDVPYYYQMTADELDRMDADEKHRKEVADRRREDKKKGIGASGREPWKRPRGHFRVGKDMVLPDEFLQSLWAERELLDAQMVEWEDEYKSMRGTKSKRATNRRKEIREDLAASKGRMGEIALEEEAYLPGMVKRAHQTRGIRVRSGGFDAQLANRLTTTTTGLMGLTAMLAVVGIAVGMALGVVIEKVSEYIKEVKEAEKAQRTFGRTMLDTSFDLDNAGKSLGNLTIGGRREIPTSTGSTTPTQGGLPTGPETTRLDVVAWKARMQREMGDRFSKKGLAAIHNLTDAELGQFYMGSDTNVEQADMLSDMMHDVRDIDREVAEPNIVRMFSRPGREAAMEISNALRLGLQEGDISKAMDEEDIQQLLVQTARRVLISEQTDQRIRDYPKRSDVRSNPFHMTGIRDPETGTRMLQETKHSNDFARANFFRRMSEEENFEEQTKLVSNLQAIHANAAILFSHMDAKGFAVDEDFRKRIAAEEKALASLVDALSVGGSFADELAPFQSLGDGRFVYSTDDARIKLDLMIDASSIPSTLDKAARDAASGIADVTRSMDTGLSALNNTVSEHSTSIGEDLQGAWDSNVGGLGGAVDDKGREPSPKMGLREWFSTYDIRKFSDMTPEEQERELQLAFDIANQLGDDRQREYYEQLEEIQEKWGHLDSVPKYLMQALRDNVLGVQHPNERKLRMGERDVLQRWNPGSESWLDVRAHPIFTPDPIDPDRAANVNATEAVDSYLLHLLKEQYPHLVGQQTPSAPPTSQLSPDSSEWDADPDHRWSGWGQFIREAVKEDEDYTSVTFAPPIPKKAPPVGLNPRAAQFAREKAAHDAWLQQFQADPDEPYEDPSGWRRTPSRPSGGYEDPSGWRTMTELSESVTGLTQTVEEAQQGYTGFILPNVTGRPNAFEEETITLATLRRLMSHQMLGMYSIAGPNKSFDEYDPETQLQINAVKSVAAHFATPEMKRAEELEAAIRALEAQVPDMLQLYDTGKFEDRRKADDFFKPLEKQRKELEDLRVVVEEQLSTVTISMRDVNKFIADFIGVSENGQEIQKQMHQETVEQNERIAAEARATSLEQLQVAFENLHRAEMLLESGNVNADKAYEAAKTQLTQALAAAKDAGVDQERIREVTSSYLTKVIASSSDANKVAVAKAILEGQRHEDFKTWHNELIAALTKTPEATEPPADAKPPAETTKEPPPPPPGPPGSTDPVIIDGTDSIWDADPDETPPPSVTDTTGASIWDIDPDNYPGFGLRGLHDGGTVHQHGSYMVGEAGPEILNLPAGSSVTANGNVGRLFDSMMNELERLGYVSEEQLEVIRKATSTETMLSTANLTLGEAALIQSVNAAGQMHSDAVRNIEGLVDVKDGADANAERIVTAVDETRIELAKAILKLDLNQSSHEDLQEAVDLKQQYQAKYKSTPEKDVYGEWDKLSGKEMDEIRRDEMDKSYRTKSYTDLRLVTRYMNERFNTALKEDFKWTDEKWEREQTKKANLQKSIDAGRPIGMNTVQAIGFYRNYGKPGELEAFLKQLGRDQKAGPPDLGMATPIDSKARGGTINQSGLYLVGEQGPELVSLNAGSFVVPNNALSNRSQGGESGPREIHITLEVGGNELGKVVVDALSEQIRHRDPTLGVF